MIVLEATGGYETGVAAALTAAGLPVAIVNPRQVRDFARALGSARKTDRLDAAVLAAFAARMQPTLARSPMICSRPAHARHPTAAACRDVHGRRNRLPLVRAAVRSNLLAHIAWLEKQVSQTDRDLRRRIAASPIWRVRDQRL